jgi:predicted ArsR family transcriptional regulator
VDTRELLAPDAGTPLGRSRGRVLELLRDAGGPLTAAEVADRCGLHPNTARFHLDALVEAELAARGQGPERGWPAPGRPAAGYRAAGEQEGPAGERRYRLLAEMLASLVAGLAGDPALTAEQAGREWGGYLTEQPPPYRQPSAGSALTELTELLASIGFDPQVQPGEAPGTAELLLRACPFREVAREHQKVICSLHLGVIRGALHRMRAPLTADCLDVFAEPGVCRARLTTQRKDSWISKPEDGAAAASRLLPEGA